MDRAKVRLWMEAREPILKAHAFHWFDRYLKGGYEGLLANAVKSTVPFDALGVKTDAFVAKILRMVFVLLFVRFLVPISGAGVTFINNTLWVGVLAFEGTTALGYIALVPWLAKVNMRGTLAFLTGGLRSELIVFASGEKQMTPEEFEVAAENELDEDRVVAKIIAGPIIQGGLLLFGVLLIMLLGVWLTSQWKVAALCVSVYWLGSLLQGLMVPATLAYSDFALSMYNHVKSEHENIKSTCPVCLGSSTGRFILSNFGVRQGGETGKLMLRIVWLMIIIQMTCVPKSTAAYTSNLWTWILLFLPINTILRLIVRFLRKLFRRPSVVS